MTLPPLPGVREGNTYLLRGPLEAPGHLWAALSLEGLWRALAASGEARWAPTSSGTGLLQPRQRSGTPKSPEPGALSPFPPFPSHAPLGTHAKKLFLAFFFLPPSPILETTTPPDVTTFLERVTWSPSLILQSFLSLAPSC